MVHRPLRQHGSHKPTLRSGFTLIELLVVMAIIALLASLLLPAVQSVRESGRRSQCISNMHNLIVAAHNYDSGMGVLPPGWIVDPNAGCNEPININTPVEVPIRSKLKVTLTSGSISPEWGWHAMLLPYIEQEKMEPDWLQAKRAGSQNWNIIQTPLQLYVCPSSSLPSDRPSRLGYTNYRGVMGYWPQSAPAALNNGTFYGNSRLSVGKDFKDGTSETMFFAETPFGFWGDALSCCSRVRDDYSSPNHFDQYWTSADSCGNAYHYFGFGGPHPGLVIIAMGDGQAKAINKSVASTVLYAISTRNGGEPTPEY
ncbi:MAG: DUF1559 domain-containing protein [Planctomycetaceae bacterium]